MATYIPPICSTQKITTECYSVLVFFPAGILDYKPKPWPDLLFFKYTYRLQRVYLLCLFLNLNKNLWPRKYPQQTDKPQVKPQQTVTAKKSTHTSPVIPPYCERAQAVTSSTGRYPSLSVLSLGQLPRQPICLS